MRHYASGGLDPRAGPEPRHHIRRKAAASFLRTAYTRSSPFSHTRLKLPAGPELRAIASSCTSSNGCCEPHYLHRRLLALRRLREEPVPVEPVEKVCGALDQFDQGFLRDLRPRTDEAVFVVAELRYLMVNAVERVR